MNSDFKDLLQCLNDAGARYLVVGGFAVMRADSLSPLLLQKPTLSRTHIAFVYGGDLWTVSRAGGHLSFMTGAIRASLRYKAAVRDAPDGSPGQTGKPQEKGRPYEAAKDRRTRPARCPARSES